MHEDEIQAIATKEEKGAKEISQLQNRQKILLNRKRTEEHRARTHRLIERGAILEAVFPLVIDMDDAKIQEFLIALSRLPGSVEVIETSQKNKSGK